MTKSKRLEPVARVAESRERRAAVELAKFRQRLEEQEARHRELLAFRDDYAHRFEQAGRDGFDAGCMANYRRILIQLGEAIAFQEQRLTALRRDCEQLRRRWTDTRTRTASLDKAIERFRGEERRDADRREQGESDERLAAAGQRRG
ncbi:MAG: flagellar export protein FliJ [Chromatiales bacterium]|nr:flagellar export protein FliJ [Chromatiales bacterium]